MNRHSSISFPIDNTTNQELLPHDNPDLDINFYFKRSNLYTQGYTPWHWHKETELYFVVEGAIKVSTSSGEFIIREMEGCFLNSNCLHSMHPYECEYALFQAIVFDPTLISCNTSAMFNQKYLYPLLKCKHIPAIPIDSACPWHSYIYERMSNISFLLRKQEFGYEIALRNSLSEIWLKLLLLVEDDIKNAPKGANLDYDRIHTMLDTIHTRYSENLSLEEIAASANVSVSECCRCFSRSLKQTPFNYLIEYRIQKAADLLLNSNQSIADISMNVGFNSSSYFSNKFKQLMGVSPREYQNQKP